MLNLEGVVFIVLVCTATAAVSGHGYDDGTAVEQSVKEVSACKNEDCDAECRSIGCARGLCAGDDCYCDIWRSKSNFSQSKLRDIITGTKKSVDDEPTCKNEDCDAECRSIGCARGLCAGDDCYCDIWRSKSNFSQSKLRDIITGTKKSVDDEPTCKNEDCDAECRSIGCARGLCAGDDCYCDIWRRIDENKLSYDGIAVGKNIKAKRCDDQDCDQQCRRYGFIKGRCIDDFCTCTPKQVSGLKRIIKDLDKCNEYECYRDCIQSGYISGTCVGNTCTCKIRLSEVSGLKRTIKDLDKCNEYECYRDCIQSGYISGTCVGNTCTCKIRLSEGTAVEQSVKEVSACKNEDCDAECRSIGCARGLCAGDDCYCDIWRTIDERKLNHNGIAVGKNIKAKRCDDQDCDQQCRRYGFIKGRCIDDFCTCTPKQDFKLLDNISGLKRTIKDLDKCNEYECYRDCIQSGYISGTCVGNTCTCKIRLSEGTTVEQSVKEVSACKNEDCDAECRSIGCARGLCAGDDCYCDIWRTIDERKLNHNEAISNIEDNEVTSNEITGCIQNTCRSACRHLGRTGGKCFRGKCQCNIKLGRLFQVLINQSSDESKEKDVSVVAN